MVIQHTCMIPGVFSSKNPCRFCF